MELPAADGGTNPTTVRNLPKHHGVLKGCPRLNVRDRPLPAQPRLESAHNKRPISHDLLISRSEQETRTWLGDDLAADELQPTADRGITGDRPSTGNGL